MQKLVLTFSAVMREDEGVGQAGQPVPIALNTVRGAA